MLVKLGQNGVKSIEDLAGCASDDLIGWTERTDAGEKKFVGYLSEFGLSREQADAMIMAARVRAGWVDEAAVAAPEEGEANEAGDEAPAN